MEMNVYITVTHNKCVRGIRVCDLVAEKFADIFYKKLVDNKITSYIVKSDKSRLIFDDNRFSTRNLNIKDSKLWNDIKKIFKYNKNNIIFDIHSFPHNTPGFGRRDIAILDIYPFQGITIILNGYMNKNNIGSEILYAAAGSNTILDIFTLHPLYTPTILLEVNEIYLNDEDKLNKIADILVEFIKTSGYTNGIDSTVNYPRYYKKYIFVI